MSDLKLVIEDFPLLALPVRILNLGNRVPFPEIVDRSAMLMRGWPSVYYAIVLSI